MRLKQRKINVLSTIFPIYLFLRKFRILQGARVRTITATSNLHVLITHIQQGGNWSSSSAKPSNRRPGAALSAVTVHRPWSRPKPWRVRYTPSRQTRTCGDKYLCDRQILLYTYVLDEIEYVEIEMDNHDKSWPSTNTDTHNRNTDVLLTQ